ncbi:type IV pilus biogenesis/stability protein PilW [Vibrio zhanjiangensis]|uniref:Type IV pilus biogenesis/stability protein PilW n=1 Tax=Vibrio zhanjiangensis TaxID=1046128 RepID=A0ABQ6EYL1_9VIBR|nr:type IV pilus biogenesis/stability protein PilW [Vibrio zhanjiangensis]GLT17801.1 type IV pilus biogenesis/stability protein PilW [Vibrio zhanjiangensis]
MRLFLSLTAAFLTACVSSSGEYDSHSKQQHKADARIELGMRYLQQSNMVKAKQNFQMALKHAPSYYRSQLAMARYFEAVSDYDQALKKYQNALESEPNNGQVLNDYGSFLCKRKKYQLAQAQLTKAVKQDDYFHIADSYENAALCWLKQNRPIEALASFRQAIAHDPKRPQTLLNLAKLEIEQGHLDAAKTHLHQFEIKFGQHPLLIMLLEELNQY